MVSSPGGGSTPASWPCRSGFRADAERLTDMPASARPRGGIVAFLADRTRPLTGSEASASLMPKLVTPPRLDLDPHLLHGVRMACARAGSGTPSMRRRGPLLDHRHRCSVPGSGPLGDYRGARLPVDSLGLIRTA